MNGTTQERLVLALKKLQAHHCAYNISGQLVEDHRGDCKFGAADNDLGGRWPYGELGNGCPELAQAAFIIEAMTEREFQSFCNLADVYVVGPV